MGYLSEVMIAFFIVLSGNLKLIIGMYCHIRDKPTCDPVNRVNYLRQKEKRKNI
jgi:hypothetical protein